MRPLLLTLLYLLSLSPSLSRAATVYVNTKEYPWEWGTAPWDFDSGMDQLRGWLESKPAPRLLDPPLALKKTIRRFHELEGKVTMKFAVLGPPRSTNGHNPHFFVWVEWVTKSKLPLDLYEKRYERKAGVAKLVLEGPGEQRLDLREWHWDKELRQKELDRTFPWDTAVIAKKMLTFHQNRLRVHPEQPNGPGKTAPY